MYFNQFFFFSQVVFYSELNLFFLGNFYNFYKYKFDSNIFFLKKGCFFYIYYYFFFYFFSNWKFFQNYLMNFFQQSFFYSIKHLKIEGRGYKLYLYHNQLIFKVGYSHLCYFLLPFSFFIFSKKKKSDYKLVSYKKDYLGNILSRLQSYRIPNQYKKKGVFIS